MMLRFFGPVLLLAGLCLLATAATARVWHVPTEAPTVQAGIDSAQVGDEVVLAVGSYAVQDLAMKPGIALRGAAEGSPDLVTLDGWFAGRIMDFQAGENLSPTLIASLTFANADSGALRCTGPGVLEVAGCVFAGNRSDWAGAMLIDGHSAGSIHVHDCVFRDNRADLSGGAVGVSWSGGVLFERCLFVRNHADQYGAVGFSGYLIDSGATYDRCTMVQNSCDQPSGAVFVAAWGAITIDRSIVAFNAAKLVTQGSGHLGGASGSCNDFFANEGDDYSLWELDDGCFSADPCFCDLAGDDYTLAGDSWCLPGLHPWGCSDLVGAYGPGCEAAGCTPPVVVERRSWSAVKGLFD